MWLGIVFFGWKYLYEAHQHFVEKRKSCTNNEPTIRLKFRWFAFSNEWSKSCEIGFFLRRKMLSSLNPCQLSRISYYALTKPDPHTIQNRNDLLRNRLYNLRSPRAERSSAQEGIQDTVSVAIALLMYTELMDKNENWKKRKIRVEMKNLNFIWVYVSVRLNWNSFFFASNGNWVKLSVQSKICCWF